MVGPMARAKTDFRVVHHGTLYLLYPNTLRAKQWVKENLSQDHMQYAGVVVVEYRYISDILDGIQADDLDIAVSKVPLPS
jgi:hypothetical protein